MKNCTIIIVLILFSFTSSSQSTKVEMLNELFETMHERGQFTGNVLVVSEGEKLFSGSYGFADRTRNVKLSENSIFNLGSVSKTFTAVAILQLGEKGKLTVDDYVTDHLPDFPYESITIGHLLTHASGLPEKLSMLENLGKNKLLTNENVMEIIYSEQPELSFSPGSQSIFNDVGYIVLAEVIEKNSGLSFDEYLLQNIYLPAGMTETGMYNAVQIPSVVNAAKGYLYSPFTQQFVEPVKTTDFGNLFALSGTQGDDNVWSTTEDLLRFCGAISSFTLLTEESVNAMFLKKTDAVMPGQQRSNRNSFSYGWIIPDAPYRIALASGNMPGFNSEIVWNLSEKRMIIYLSNDFLSFTSYNTLLPYSVGTVITQDTLVIPKKWASVELTNKVLHLSNDEVTQLINQLKADSENIDFDVPGIEYLISRLIVRGENDKAQLIKDQISTE